MVLKTVKKLKEFLATPSFSPKTKEHSFRETNDPTPVAKKTFDRKMRLKKRNRNCLALLGENRIVQLNFFRKIQIIRLSINRAIG